MLYYNSPRMKLSGSHSIVVAFGNLPEGARVKVFFMNSCQTYHFWHTGVISKQWMPLDHVAELTEADPVARFDVSGSDDWIVVVERSQIPPPLIAIDEGPEIAQQLWITMSNGNMVEANDDLMSDWNV